MHHHPHLPGAVKHNTLLSPPTEPVLQEECVTELVGVRRDLGRGGGSAGCVRHSDRSLTPCQRVDTPRGLDLMGANVDGDAKEAVGSS